MKKHLTVTFIAAAAVLSLAACSGGGSEQAAPTATQASKPSLKVPTTMTGTTANLIVNGGNLVKGTSATVYAYAGGWDAAKITCDDPSAVSQALTITGDGSEQTVAFPVRPGIVGWVLVAGSFSTPCNAEESRTTVKVAGNVDILTPKEHTKAGVARPITVWAKGKPETLPVMANVKILGPWATIPEAIAADCKTAPVAGGAKVEIKPTTGGNVSDQFNTSITPDKIGVYRVTASLPETAQSTAVDTCEDGAQPTVFVASGK